MAKLLQQVLFIIFLKMQDTMLDLQVILVEVLHCKIAEEPHAYYVIELSSFQLDNMYDFRANIAILLNITPDHLDRYENKFEKYADAKMRIIQNQTHEDSFIYWNDDPVIKKRIRKVRCKSGTISFL